MFQYLSNIFLDVYYGYVEIKCINCGTKFKLSRNNINLLLDISTNYSCNIGCALNYMNKIKN